MKKEQFVTCIKKRKTGWVEHFDFKLIDVIAALSMFMLIVVRHHSFTHTQLVSSSAILVLFVLLFDIMTDMHSDVITGMWQTSGRSDITDFEEVIKLDMEYIRNMSVMFDLKLIFKTVRDMLRGRQRRKIKRKTGDGYIGKHTNAKRKKKYIRFYCK